MVAEGHIIDDNRIPTFSFPSRRHAFVPKGVRDCNFISFFSVPIATLLLFSKCVLIDDIKCLFVEYFLRKSIELSIPSVVINDFDGIHIFVTNFFNGPQWSCAYMLLEMVPKVRRGFFLAIIFDCWGATNPHKANTTVIPLVRIIEEMSIDKAKFFAVIIIDAGNSHHILQRVVAFAFRFLLVVRSQTRWGHEFFILLTCGVSAAVLSFNNDV